MGLDEVKKVVQPELDQDFDALYEEFVQETGQQDVVEFLLHLHDFGLISEELITQLSDDSTLAKQRPGQEASVAPPTESVKPIDWDAADDDEWDEATVLRSVDDLMAMTEDAKVVETAEPPVDEFTVPGAPQMFRPPNRPEEHPSTEFPIPDPATPTVVRREQGLGLGLIQVPEDDEEADDPNARKRTSFRKRGDGKLEETGTFRRQVRRNPEPKKPRTIDTRYTMLGMVGEGAMGSVMLADDGTLGRKVAYKEMSPDIADQPPLASKFLIEAQITAQLDHPNIVPVYDLQGNDAYTMKLIKGETIEEQLEEIRERIKAGKALDHDQSLEARLDTFLKICEAMAYAHSRGVVHRDLKPENVMIGEFGEVYVMDWGIAHVMPGPFDEPVNIEGMVDEGDLIIGTAGYMSPEQADARTAELSGASDQYALGLILFETVSLRHAVTGKNAMHIITRHQMGEVDRLSHLRGERIAPELAAIIRKATQEKAESRYKSVTALADDLRRFLRGESVAARPDNPWQWLVRFTGRHRQATLLAVASVLMASVFFVMLVGIYTSVALSRADARQRAMSALTSEVGRQASKVDGQLTRLEGLLLILSTTSEDMLTIGDVRNDALFTSADFDTSTKRPADTEEGRAYPMPVSLENSAFVLPSSVKPTDRYDILPKLLPMNRHFRKVLLRSKSEDAAQFASKLARRTLKDVGVPIRWAYIALDSGAYDVYPGHGGYDAGFDPRTTPWYKRAGRADGPVWSMPARDDDGGKGLVVPCSIGLHNAQGDLLGVAGIDVAFEFFSEKLMPIDALRDTSAKVYIVDSGGRILIDPAMTSPEGRRAFPVEEVVTAIKNKRSGVTEYGGEVTVYTRMNSLDWYYVVTGPTSELLSAL